jgi:hypothetical protein
MLTPRPPARVYLEKTALPSRTSSRSGKRPCCRVDGMVIRYFDEVQLVTFPGREPSFRSDPRASFPRLDYLDHSGA